MGNKSCHECLHIQMPDWNKEEAGRCLLAKKRWGGDLRVSPRQPACKGFESKEPKYKAGRRR